MSGNPEPVTEVLETAGAWLPGRLSEVERMLRETAGSAGRLSGQAVETLAAGGKRMRPMLVLLCAGPDGDDRALRAAVAVELIHTASLVHDDVLDRAPLRRGRPTVFSISGRERATSVGDVLFAGAFEILARSGDRETIDLLAGTAVDLARGELMQRSGAFDLGLVEDAYFARCSLKTGSLFSASCVAGVGSRPTATATGPVALFGSRIGLAFQMLDDVLDICGPPERTGKARGTDLLDGTVTLPLILAMERDPSLHELDLRSLDAEGAVEICDRIEATGALDEVRARALGTVEEAKHDLEQAGLDPESRLLLDMVADGVVARYS